MGEIGVRGRADEKTARQLAVLVRVPTKPRPRAATRAEGIQLQDRRLVQAARLSALAPHDEISQIAAGAAFVEPELPPAQLGLARGSSGILNPVHEAMPVNIINVALRAGADKPGGHHRPAIETALLVECLPMNKAPRALAFFCAAGLLLGKTPRAYAPCRLARIV
jgi:hypothetical protein